MLQQHDKEALKGRKYQNIVLLFSVFCHVWPPFVGFCSAIHAEHP